MDSPRDNFFRFDLHAKSAALNQVVDAIESDYHADYRRARTGRACRVPRKHRAKLSSIVANVVWARLSKRRDVKFHLDEAHYKLASDHPRHAIETRSFPRIVKDLERLRYVVVKRGAQGNLSRMSGGARLAGLLADHEWSFADVGGQRSNGGVTLKAAGKGSAEIAIPDRPEWRAIQIRMETFNHALASRLIATDGASLCAWDPQDRALRRIFHYGRVDRYGRMHGAWVEQPKAERCYIWLDGERCTQLDISAMFLSVLYAWEGHPAPIEPYKVREVERAFEELGQTQATARDSARSAVKAMCVSLLFDEGARRRFPKDVRVPWPKGAMTAQEMVEAISAKHPLIAHYFGSGVGHKLFYAESEITLSAVERCLASDITALPIHDALLVPRSVAERAARILAEVFRAQLGQWPIIKSQVQCTPVERALMEALGLESTQGVFASPGGGGDPRWVERQIITKRRRRRPPEVRAISQAILGLLSQMPPHLSDLNRLPHVFVPQSVLGALIYTAGHLSAERWGTLVRRCVCALDKPALEALLRELKAVGAVPDSLALSTPHSKHGEALL